MQFDTLNLAVADDGVARLTLARPDRHNALSAEMIEDLRAAATFLDNDRDVRCVILAGAGASFCAGADLGWMKAQIEGTRKQRLEAARALASMLQSFNTLSKPTIARVHGSAFGGGIGLMAVCDVAVVADDVRLGFPETRLGLIPATISPYVIARTGESNARRLFLSGRVFGGFEAMRIGLATRCTSVAELDLAVASEVEPFLSTAPGAVAAAKRLVRGLGPEISDAVIARIAASLADCWEGAEAQEGVRAFLEKRKPWWVRK